MAGAAQTARLTDLWVGVCCCHSDPTCIPMTGRIITASKDTFSTIKGQGRLVDQTIGECGHPGKVIQASNICFANERGKAFVGAGVTGCNIGNVVTGNKTHFIGIGPSGGGPLVITEFQDRLLVHSEVDFGNEDDEEGVDDGLNVYPPVEGREPTVEEVRKSALIDVSPTTTVEIDTTATTVASTPPTSCLEVPDPPPDNFQLSTNFTLGDLSSQTVISKKAVKAQHGLSVVDMVCNLQGWAEHIGEPLATTYGRGEMIITSGFRTGNGSSQHERGQATDIQFPNMSNTEVYNVAQFIRNTLPFDQLILEYGGNRPWIHSSFNRAGNRPVVASNKFGTRISPGNYVFGELRNMA
jgi:hypothetical protein